MIEVGARYEKRRQTREMRDKTLRAWTEVRDAGNEENAEKRAVEESWKVKKMQ